MHLLASPSIQTMSSKRSVTVHTDTSYYSQPARQLNTQPQILFSPSAPHQQLFSQQSEQTLQRQVFSYQKDENHYDYRKKEGNPPYGSLLSSITSERINKSKRTFTEHSQRTSAISSVCVQEDDQEGINRVTNLLEELKSPAISAQRVFPSEISAKLDEKMVKQLSKNEEDEDEIATNAMEQSTFRGQSDVKSYMQSLLFKSKRNSITELESPEDGDYCYNSTSNSSGWETTMRDHLSSGRIPSRRQQINLPSCFQQSTNKILNQQALPLSQQCTQQSLTLQKQIQEESRTQSQQQQSLPARQEITQYPIPQQGSQYLQQPQKKDSNCLLNQKIGFIQRTPQQLSSQQLLTKQSPLNHQNQLVHVTSQQNNLKQPTRAFNQDILKDKCITSNGLNGNYLSNNENINHRTKLENNYKDQHLADNKVNNVLLPSENRFQSLQTEVKNRTNSLFFESSKDEFQTSFSSTKSVERKRKIFETANAGVGYMQGIPVARNGNHSNSSQKEQIPRQSMNNNNNSKDESQILNEFETSTIEEKQQDIFRKQQMPLNQLNKQPGTFHPFSLHSINSSNINININKNNLNTNNNCINSSSINLADNSIFSSNQIPNPNNISSMSSLLDELSFLKQTTHSPAQIPPTIPQSQGLLPNQRNAQFLDSNKQLCYIDSKQQLRNDLAKRRQKQLYNEQSDNKENILLSGMQNPVAVPSKHQGNESILILKNINYQVYNQDLQQYNSYQQQQQQNHQQLANFQSLNNNNNNSGKPINNPQKISQTPMKTLNLLTIARKKGIFYTTTDKKSLMAPLSKLL